MLERGLTDLEMLVVTKVAVSGRVLRWEISQSGVTSGFLSTPTALLAAFQATLKPEPMLCSHGFC